MTREIKFRAWDDNEKQMYENVQNSDFDAFLNSGSYDIMQFTGLKDKNGKEIYEGDILKMPADGNEPHYNWKVSWSEKHFQFRCGAIEGGSNYPLEDFKSYLVIGNIYENPELTKSHV